MLIFHVRWQDPQNDQLWRSLTKRKDLAQCILWLRRPQEKSQIRWTCAPLSGDNQSQVSSRLCRASCDSCSKALIKVNYKLYEKKPVQIKKRRFNLSILLCVQQLISGFVVLAFEPWLKMKLTLPSSAPESLINLQTIHLCFLSVFTAACAKTTASIIFIPYFFKTRQKNKKKPKTKQRRGDVSMHRCRFSTGVFVHLSLRRRRLLGASCDTSMSLYLSFYAQSPACCSILHQRVSLPICALNKKRKLSFLCIFHPKFQLSQLNFCCSLCHLLGTSNFLLSVLSNANSDFWPWVACSFSHSKKKKKKKEKQRGNAFWGRFWISNQRRQLQPCPSVENLRRGSFDYHAWSMTSCLLVLPVMSHAVLLWFIYCLMDYGRSSQLRWSQTVYFHSRDSNEQFY